MRKLIVVQSLSSYEDNKKGLYDKFSLFQGSRKGMVKYVTLEPSPKGSCTYPRGRNVTFILELELGKFDTAPTSTSLNYSCHSHSENTKFCIA